jgi:hypothetical protein
MNQTLKEAYQKITGQEPTQAMANWQLADYLVDDFSLVFRADENLAQKVLFTVINHDIGYPNEEITKRIVGKAEGLAEELEIVAEGHMADVERYEAEQNPEGRNKN